jgi:DNA-binding winged helix-turn-helix (wHTH) protein/tetratricopeptide (TPR) repeat protein
MVQDSRKMLFASYSFDPRTGELTRYGIRLRLETQPAKILSILMEARGELVRRSALIAALWPGEVEGNFDRRLDKAIAKLRASLNDDPAKPRYIETLKGRGYRFLESVTLEPGAEDSIPPLPEKPSAVEFIHNEQDPEAAYVVRAIPAQIRKRFVTLQLIAGFSSLVLILSVLAWWMHAKSVANTHHRPVVLISGFRAISHSPEDAWIAPAVSYWLATDLGVGQELQVVQTGNNPEFQGQGYEGGCGELPHTVLETAHRAFSADMVIYGNYSETEDAASGDHWKLDVCLENAWNRRGPESITVVGARGDIAQLVFNAGQALRSKLGLKPLSSQSLGYLRATLPSNLAAARLYAEGISALEHFEPEEATALLMQTTQIEPQHVATHAALSTAWRALGYLQRSEQEAMTARELSKGLSPIQQLEYEGLADEAKSDWSAAIDAYAKLFQRYPDNIDYGLKLANAYIGQGKGQLALETIRTLSNGNRTALADPRVDLAEAAADFALSNFSGELAASIKAASHAEAQSSGLLIADAQMEQATADDLLGNWPEAFRLSQLAEQSYESIGDSGGMADAFNHQANLAWKKGDAANARKLFEESISLSKNDGDNVRLAYSLSRLGIVRMAVDRAPGGEMPEAVKMYRQAATIYHAIGNTAEEGYVISLLGDEAMQRLQYEEAHTLYAQAMALSQAANDRSRIAGRLLDLGIVDQVEGRNPEAINFFEQSSKEYDNLGQRDSAAIARIRLGISLFRSGKIEDADHILLDSLATMRSFGRLNQEREVLGDLARLELVRNPAKAESLAREQLKLYEQLVVGNVCCSANYALIAQALVEQGKLPEASEEIRKAFSPEREQVTEPLPDMLLARGNIRMNSKDYADARTDFEEVAQMAHRRGVQYVELEARLGLAELDLLQRGKSAQTKLNQVKHDANQLGYGIFDIKIDAFIRLHRTLA